MVTNAKKTVKKNNKPSGYIIYQNKVIVVIMIIRSSNKKTGNMVQTYIIRKDVNPLEALKNGKDKAICGDCIHRGRFIKNEKTGKIEWKRTCYVNVGQGVLQVYKSYIKGNYPKYNPHKHDVRLLDKNGNKRMIRLGTYGDPAFVPLRVWEYFLPKFDGKTGYTHQWGKSWIDPNFKNIVMASCDSKSNVNDSNAIGYRSFIVVPHDEKIAKINDMNAINCLSDSIGRKCEECGLCNGNEKNKGKNVYINAHGSSKRFVLSLV
jgi:hypothetical protein